jgi:hypothetical protein
MTGFGHAPLCRRAQTGLSRIYEVRRRGGIAARIHRTSAVRRRLAVETQDSGTIYQQEYC